MGSPVNRAKSASRLNQNQVYTGQVVAVDRTSRTVTVQFDNPRVQQDSCVFAPNIFSPLLGTRLKFLPPLSSLVLCAVVGATVYIFGCLKRPDSGRKVPASKLTEFSDDLDVVGMKSSTDFTTAEPNADSGQDFPEDMVEGELDATSLLGVGLQLLTLRASIKAGDLAVVETCLVNNLVRMVSQTYRNYNAFGQFEIFRKGGTLNCHWLGTMHEHEMRDGESKTAPGPEADAKDVVKLRVDLDDAKKEGRMRFQMLIGHIGDMLNIYVTDPVKVFGSVVSGNTPSGRFRFNVASTGSVLLQSVEDIVIERVVRIPVPIPLKKWDDPDGAAAAALRNLQATSLRVWDHQSNNPFHAVFQIREQAKWYSGYHSLAKLRALAALGQPDWKVPTEAETDAPVFASGDADRVPVQADTGFILTYATWRIYRDGTILSLSGDGSSIVQGNGSIHMSALKHVFVDIGGDFNVLANDINLRARRNSEMTADVGSTTIKGATGARVWADAGPVQLRGKANASEAAVGSLPGDPVPDRMTRGTGDAERNSGILLESTGGGIHVRAEGDSVVDIQRGDGDGDLRLNLHSLKVSARRNLELFVARHVVLKVGLDLFVRAANFVADVTSVFRLGQRVVIRNGDLHAGTIKAETVRASSLSTYGDAPVSSRYRQWAADADVQEKNGRQTWSTDPETPGADLVAASTALSSAILPNVPDLNVESYPAYAGGSVYIPEASLFRSVTQTLAAGMINQSKFSIWTLTGEQTSGKLRFPKVGENSVPYPGKTATQLGTAAGGRLDRPYAGTPSGKGDPLSAVPFTMFVVKAANMGDSTSEITT